MDKLPYDPTNPSSIEKYAQEMKGKTFLEILESCDEETSLSTDAYRNKYRKGGLGNLIEEKFFHYKINSNPTSDFEEAGVELKVSPYELTKNNLIRAGERLVLTMISYKEPVEPDFFHSHLWKKCALLLLVYYLREKDKENLDFHIDFIKLFNPPEEDLIIIEQDYKKIISKIQAGKAHEISEGDTMYLGACTKGASAIKSMAPQFYGKELARKRAFCYKMPYMTYVLNKYIVSDTTVNDSIAEVEQLKEQSFEELISSKIQQFIGKTDRELCELFAIPYNNAKSRWSKLAFQMLGVRSNSAAEFEKANIEIKTIRLESNCKIKESMSFPTFKFKKLIKEKWEKSDLYQYFNNTKLFFVIFQKVNGNYVLKGCKLWNMPYSDLNNIVKQGWEKTREIINNGVQLISKENGIVENNLPKSRDNTIIHVRPHASKAFYQFEDGRTCGNGSKSDADLLPDGRWMTKQCFWLNNSYVIQQISEFID